MKKRNELCNTITNVIKKEIISKPSAIQKHIINLGEKKSIPYSILNDVFTLKTYIQDYEDLIVYSVAEELKVSTKTYFDETELKSLIHRKYKVENKVFPIRWEMIEITDNQWIGRITMKELMKLRDAQLINYNENTQRVMKFVNGIWRIALNHVAIEKIMNSFIKRTYIPNTITLNIPEDAEFDYDGQYLTITVTDHLDMLDGYHRYISGSNCFNKNPDFDYPMELRLVAFDDATARHFIFQEDQKTKMKKVDSDSFDINNNGNVVVDSLNKVPMFAGVLSSNGNINGPITSKVISNLNFKDKRRNSRSLIIETVNKYKQGLFNLLNEDSELLDSRWDTKYIACAFYIMNKYPDDINNLEKINTLYKKLSNKKYSHILVNDNVTNQDINRLDKVYEGRM